MAALGYLALVIFGIGAAAMLFMLGLIAVGLFAAVFVVVFICYCVWDWFQ